MQLFVRNLALLALIGIGLLVVAPETMRSVIEIYGGLGLLPVLLTLVLLAALPRRSNRRRR